MSDPEPTPGGVLLGQTAEREQQRLDEHRAEHDVLHGGVDRVDRDAGDLGLGDRRHGLRVAVQLTVGQVEAGRLQPGDRELEGREDVVRAGVDRPPQPSTRARARSTSRPSTAVGVTADWATPSISATDSCSASSCSSTPRAVATLSPPTPTRALTRRMRRTWSSPYCACVALVRSPSGSSPSRR